MTLRTYAALSAALALAACAAPAYPPAAMPAPAGGTPSAGMPAAPSAGMTVEQAVATITPADVYARIEFLASDVMRGRDTPSPELEIAANYLVSQYKQMGFEPGGEGGTFYHGGPFPCAS